MRYTARDDRQTAQDVAQAWAAEKGLTKNAAYVQLIERALIAAEKPPPPTRKPAKAAKAPAPKPEPHSAALFGMVPLHKPKPFNPQPKKGAKR